MGSFARFRSRVTLGSFARFRSRGLPRPYNRCILYNHGFVRAVFDWEGPWLRSRGFRSGEPMGSFARFRCRTQVKQPTDAYCQPHKHGCTDCRVRLAPCRRASVFMATPMFVGPKRGLADVPSRSEQVTGIDPGKSVDEEPGSKTGTRRDQADRQPGMGCLRPPSPYL